MPMCSSNYPDYPHLSSPALVAKLSWDKSTSLDRRSTQKVLFSSEDEDDSAQELQGVFEQSRRSPQAESSSKGIEEDENSLEKVEVLDYSKQYLIQNVPQSSWKKSKDPTGANELEEEIEEIFLKYFEPCIEEMCSIRDDYLSQSKSEAESEALLDGSAKDRNEGIFSEEDYIRSESSDSAVEIMTEEEEMLYDPGRYFTEMINEVFGGDVPLSSQANKTTRLDVANFHRGTDVAGRSDSCSTVSIPLIPLVSSPPLLSLSTPNNGEVKSKVSQFESLFQQDSTPRGGKTISPRTQLWFHKDGIRTSSSSSTSSCSKEEDGEVSASSTMSQSMHSPLDYTPREKKPPIHPKSPISPRLRSQKTTPTTGNSEDPKEDTRKMSVMESNRILRNSLGKMEPSERIKLEEILDMCVEYERQIESQMESKGGGMSEISRTPSNGGSASLIPMHSPNGSAHPKGIKTNGSLPREKRHASPCKETESIIFNFDGVTKVNEEGGPSFIPPSSPRTRIRTFLGNSVPLSSNGPSSPFSSPPALEAVPLDSSGGLEEAAASSPISRKPPRSKHDNGPSSPFKDAEEPTSLVSSPSLPSEEAPSRLLIGMTMLNHKHSSNFLHHRNTNGGNFSSGGKSQYSEFDNSSRMVEALKSQRHTQILILSTVKRQLSDLESEAAEGLKELELERSLIMGEREAEANELDKLKLRCSQLKTQEARLSGVFQELQKSLSRKTDNAKRKLLEAKEEIERLEYCLRRENHEREEESLLLLRLKEQQEILDNETKAFEDLEFHQMEEETSKETEREELLNEISEVEALVREKAMRLEEIDSQRQKILYNARNETQSLLAQRQKLLLDLDRERIKLSSIERRLASFLLPSDEDERKTAAARGEDPETLISTSSSIEEDEEEMRVAHWSQNSELDIALKRLDLFGTEQDGSLLHQTSNSQSNSRQKASMESGHSTAIEDDSEDEGIRISIASSYQESNGRTRKSNTEKIESFNMDGEYLSHSSSESTKSSSLSTKQNSGFKDSSRPISDESSYWDENDPSSIEVKRRGNKPQQTQRPLTRYLPIRNEGFDLRVHIESAGHPIDSNPAVSRHILLNSSSCRGHLYKMSSKFRKWNRRWFVFDRNKRTLIYYSDKTETKAKGGIYFESIEDVYVDHLNSLKSPRQKETFLMKTRDRLYCLMAPSIETMRIWIDVIFTGAEGFQGYTK